MPKHPLRRLLPALCLLCGLLCGCTAGTDPEQLTDDPDRIDWDRSLGWVFDQSVIPEIHINVSTDEWNRLLKAYDGNPGTKEYVSCDVKYIKDGESVEIPQAALRLRGNTSRRRPEGGGGEKHSTSKPDWHHCHFILDFHHTHKNAYHTIKGVRKVDLKWFKDDPSYVREVFCYDVFRRFGVWTAARDVYARVWIKVENTSEAYFGVYGMLEHIDREFIASRREGFGDTSGSLWKCSYGADLRRTSADFSPEDDKRDHVYELKSSSLSFEEAREQLRDFISKLGSLKGDRLYDWLASTMDIDLLLRTYAVNVAVGMWDDYWNNSNNYYLYVTREGKVFFIPFDYDNTLGTSYFCGVQSDSGRQDPYAWGSGDNPLILTVLQNPRWKAQYRSYLKELCGGEGLCSPYAAIRRISEWQGRIRPYVTNDTGEDCEIADLPAPWGNHPEYRLLSQGKNNFFEVKAGVVSSLE